MDFHRPRPFVNPHHLEGAIGDLDDDKANTAILGRHPEDQPMAALLNEG